MREPTLLRPTRLLLDVKALMQTTGLGRDACLKLLHRAGPVRMGRRLLARPADIERVFEELRQEVPGD